MALYTDGAVVDAEELTRYETSLLDVLRTESVPADRKIALAQEECGIALTDFLRRNLSMGGGTDTDLLNRVVVDARLRRWVALRALWGIFRDAYTRQLNDRYAGKREEYASLMRDAEERYLANGVGLVGRPVARPDKPKLDTVAGSGPIGTFYVAVTRWDATAGESAASDLSSAGVNAGSLLRVRVNTTGNWQVYVGESLSAMTRQNGEPITGDEWLLNEPLRDGSPVPQGQFAETVVRWRRLLRRG